jgi:hypothetical protein
MLRFKKWTYTCAKFLNCSKNIKLWKSGILARAIMNFTSVCVLPRSPEEILREVIKRVKILKSAWMKWLETRDRLCREIGLDDTIFAIRDVVEIEFELPPWSAKIMLGEKGPEIIVDPYFLGLWSSKLKELDRGRVEKISARAGS